jgi:hypothetical protein
MNPDVERAIDDLVQRGVLPEEKAAPLRAVARGQLVSLYAELRLIFYLGVLLATGGVGVLVARNYEHIGPVAVAVALGVIAAGALLWVARTAPRFSWDETPSPSIAFDYILVLGLLVAAADLGFIEMQFTPLGAQWPFHLLIVSAVMVGFAVRYDSRTVFSLGLSTFAAWRGVSAAIFERFLWRASEDVVRWNAIVCGMLFVLLGLLLIKSRRKPHFEPVAAHLGWLLVLGAFALGGFERTTEGNLYTALLAAAGFGLAWYAFRQHRFALFAFGVLGVYIAASQLVVRFTHDEVMNSIWFIASSIALMAWLWKAQRKLKEPS